MHDFKAASDRNWRTETEKVRLNQAEISTCGMKKTAPDSLRSVSAKRPTASVGKPTSPATLSSCKRKSSQRPVKSTSSSGWNRQLRDGEELVWCASRSDPIETLSEHQAVLQYFASCWTTLFQQLVTMGAKIHRKGVLSIRNLVDTSQHPAKAGKYCLTQCRMTMNHSPSPPSGLVSKPNLQLLHSLSSNY